MTLNKICTIGQNELDNFGGVTPSAQTQQVEPIQETCSEESGDPMTEEKVRFTVLRVLNRLANLPTGTWTTPPQSTNFGGVPQRTVRRGNVALCFKLQTDPTTLKTTLRVVGYNSENEQKATLGR